MQFEWQLQTAYGYAELSMTRESLAELDSIDKRFQNRPEVLQLRLHHLMRKKKWALALRVSQKLCRTAPDTDAGFLHANFCLHQLSKTTEAKNLLITGPITLLKEPIYYYNMKYYETLLSNVRDAQTNLQISFKMDSSFRDLTKKDPDLKALHAVISFFFVCANSGQNSATHRSRPIVRSCKAWRRHAFLRPLVAD